MIACGRRQIPPAAFHSIGRPAVRGVFFSGTAADELQHDFARMRRAAVFGQPALTGTLRLTPLSIALMWAGMSSGPSVS